MNPSIFFNEQDRRGSVLIIVLVICLGLVSLTLVFGHAMMMAYRGEDNELAGRQAEAAVLGAEQYAETVLANSSIANTLPDRSTYQASAVPVGEAFFWFIGEPLASDPIDKPAFSIVDEASKLNLNSASVTSLALLPNMTPDLALAIQQWRSTAGTASGITFNVVKGGPFESPEELALVNGGTDPSVLYGDDANLNHVFDPEESSGVALGGTSSDTPSTGGNPGTGSATSGTGATSGQFTPGFLEYVTTFSREPNTLSDGTKRGNVLNRTGVLTALTTALGSSRAASVEQAVGTGAIDSVVDFCNKANLTPDEWNTVAPYLTMSSGNYQVGLVNACTARAEVLACLPGMTPALAQQLVAARPQPGTTAYGNLQWTVAVLGAQAGTIGRYLTARSYQFSVDVAAVGRHGRGYRRTLFVLDTSTNPGGAPQLVYRRNLTSLGWALGSDVRASLQQAAAQPGGGSIQP